MNKFGLPRHIPEDVKRQIRKNSKFGCVVPNCRNSFYTYEHLIPEYKNAQIHDPEKICLTCPTHNPRKEGTEGQANYSKEQLVKYYEQLQSRTQGPPIKNNDFFSGFEREVEIVLGKSSYINVKSIINVDGEDIFSFRRNNSEDVFEPQVLFSGKFRRPNGEILFTIVDNEWQSPTDHWDLESKNGKITIFDSEKSVIFQAEKLPSRNVIKIERLDLWHSPFHITVKEGELFIGRVDIENSKHIYIGINETVNYGDCAVYLTSNNLHFPLEFYGVRMRGGKGTELIGNGVYLGKGSSSSYLRGLSLFWSDNVVDKSQTSTQANRIPADANYFIKGIVEERVIKFPLWNESEFWLNGQKLDDRPHSWGPINEKWEQLYYISRGESLDLSDNPGFVGFYADDFNGHCISGFRL
jgi:hypothetical protein